jgi:apolipoprotein N-acyltransferase
MGAVAATGQEPFDLWFLSLCALGVGVLRVSLAETARQGFWRGWAFGFGYFDRCFRIVAQYIQRRVTVSRPYQ